MKRPEPKLSADAVEATPTERFVTRRSKSFLVLFFKKELLSSLACPARLYL